MKIVLCIVFRKDLFVGRISVDPFHFETDILHGDITHSIELWIWIQEFQNFRIRNAAFYVIKSCARVREFCAGLHLPLYSARWKAGRRNVRGRRLPPGTPFRPTQGRERHHA